MFSIYLQNVTINFTCFYATMGLTHHIDSHVTSLVLIKIFALEVGFAGINVSFTFVIKVILYFIFSPISPHLLVVDFSIS